MDNTYKSLEEKEKIRYKVLEYIYSQVNGSQMRVVDLSRFFRDDSTLSVQEMEEYNSIRDAINFLEENQLIEGDSVNEYSITREGIIKVERLIKNQSQPKDNLSFPVVQVFNAPVGNIQTGNNNSSYVSQVNNIGSEVQDFMQKLKQLVDNLPENNKQDASEIIENLEEEITNPTKLSRLKSYLVHLWRLGKEVAGFANSVSAIAERFGVDLSSF